MTDKNPKSQRRRDLAERLEKLAAHPKAKPENAAMGKKYARLLRKVEDRQEAKKAK